jgi:hypothetical protein
LELGGERLGEDVDGWERPQRQHGEHRVGDRQDHGDRSNGGEVGDGERNQHDRVLDLLQVVVGPAHELAGLLAVVEGEVEPLQVGEEPVAQHGLGLAGLPEGRVPPQTGEGGDEHAGDGDEQGVVHHRALVLGLHALVDGEGHQRGHRDLGGGPRERNEGAEGDPPPLRPQLGADQPPAVSYGTRFRT